jgi:GAF domain-containing protein
LNRSLLLKELIDIGIALTSERDLALLPERILTEARRFTHAEAGTLFLREKNELRFAVVQNDLLAQRLGEPEMRRLLQSDPLSLSKPSLAGYVALSGEVLCLPDAYAISPERAYAFNPAVDARTGYRTRSVLVVPLKEPAGNVLGVFQLINARDDRGQVVAFDPGYEELIRALASQAAVAIRNARLEETAREREALWFVTSLATAAAHEINNPLGVIKGNLQLLARETADTIGHERIDAVLAAVDTIAEIVKRLSRITDLKLAHQSKNLPPMLDIRESSAHPEGERTNPEQS